MTQSEITLRFTRPEERHLFAYSHSKVEAILTCPVWGLIRYVENKTFPTVNRAMPLEAGSAMHEVFAGARLWQLLRMQNLPDLFQFHGERLFGKERFDKCWAAVNGKSASHRDELIGFLYQILNSGEFYDDPDDGMRTLANMEVTIIRFVDWRLPNMERNPIWVRDRSDPRSDVGIEIPFDVIVSDGDVDLRYIGTIDGIVTPLSDNPDYAEGKLETAVLDENKTASRLDDAWRKSYMVKSQPTGYIAVARMITGLVIDSVRMIGVKVKQTRSSEDLQAFKEFRSDHQIAKWVQSLKMANEFNLRYGADPLQAPQFTHSCSRYFRPCSLINLCAAEPEDQQIIYGSMVPGHKSPSEQALEEIYERERTG